MRDSKKVAQYGLDALLEAGADKAECSLTLTDKHELNVELGEFALMRTTFDTQVGLTAIRDNKKGSTSINKSDNDSLDRAAADALDIAAASSPDDAYDIAEAQPPAVFSCGSDSPDVDRMHSRMKEMLESIKVRYPKLVLREAYLDFTRTRNYFLNSNGVDFVTNKGVYTLVAMFSSRDGEKVSSFNYTAFSLKDLERDLLSCGSLDMLMQQSTEQTNTRPLEGKFIGDMIITPDCLGDMLHFLSYSIGDGGPWYPEPASTRTG